jgi:hypothetical protein
MPSRLGLAAITLFVVTIFFFTRTKPMSSNAEQPQVVQEDTTPQQLEQQKHEPEPASRNALSGLRFLIPFPNQEDLAKARGRPGGSRIGRPVEPPVDA